MPGHIDLNHRYSRRIRPESKPRPDWRGPDDVPRAPLEILGLLRRYRYLTRSLLALAYSGTRGGRGAEEIKNHLTRLWQYGYVERFFRATPPGEGSQQFVYTLSREGARLLIPPKDLATRWPVERFKVQNRTRSKSSGYEHALAVSLFQILWDLGSPAAADTLKTIAYWPDRDGDRDRRINSFKVRLDGKDVRLNPDTTVWLEWQHRRPPYQPLFVEIERSHKNQKRLVHWFRAYQQLLTHQAAAVTKVCRREIDSRIEPMEGAALFIAPDHDRRDRLRQVALETVGAVSRNIPRVPEFWFSSLDDLFERLDDEETFIEPAALFQRKIAVSLSGKAWSIVGPTELIGGGNNERL